MKEGLMSGIIIVVLMVTVLFSYTIGFYRGISNFVQDSEMHVNESGTISIYYMGNEYIHE